MTSRLSKLISPSTWKSIKYLTKKSQTPKTSLLQIAVTAYALNYIHKKVSSHMSASAKIYDQVQKVAQEGYLTSVENDSLNYWEAKIDKVLVLVNPAASDGECGKKFDQLISPILDVAGIDIDVLKTQSYIGIRESAGTFLTDKYKAIIVVGGDGTVSDLLTGLMRRKDGEDFLFDTPIAIIPTGKRNQIYKNLIKNQTAVNFYTSNKDEQADLIISETNRIINAINSNEIKEKCTNENLIKFQIKMSSDDPEEEKEEDRKPIYGINGIEWGLGPDIKERRKHLWGICPLKDNFARYLQDRDKTMVKAHLDFQYDKVTEREEVKQTGSYFQRSMKPTVKETEVFKFDNYIDIDVDDIKIQSKKNKDLELCLSKNIGSGFDIFTNKAYLTEIVGNRPGFYHGKLKIESGSKKIYIDGNELDLESGDELGITNVKNGWYLIQ